MTLIYVYAKDGKIKVLNHEKALEISEKLVSKGWVHTHTLDACVYLECLHNDIDYWDKATYIESLSHKE